MITIEHTSTFWYHGVPRALAKIYAPTFKQARYATGDAKPNYPMPALLVDSVSDLSVRWSQWLDTMAIDGIRI